MTSGRIRRNSRRGALALVVGVLGLMAGSLLVAPGADAATTVPVHIKDLTPPLISIDPGDSVAFDDQIQDKTVQVGGSGGLLPSLVTAVVHTDVTLGIPDNQPQNQHVLKPGDPAYVRQFTASCLTCTITYTYRVSVPNTSVAGGLLSTVTSQALALVPQNQVVTFNGQQTTVTIGVPTPFIVNTLVPLPNLPSINLPKIPQINVPNPGNIGGVVPKAGVPSGTQSVTTTTTTTTMHGIDGNLYAYDVPGGVPQLAPLGNSAAAAFDPSRLSGKGSGGGSSTGAVPGGAGGLAGPQNSASVPVFGLDGTKLASAQRPAGSPAGTLPVPALLAIVAMAGAVAALVRTHQAVRAQRSGH